MSAAMQADETLPDIKFTITITAKPSERELEIPLPPQALSVLGIHPDTDVTVNFADDDPQKPVLKIIRV